MEVEAGYRAHGFDEIRWGEADKHGVVDDDHNTLTGEDFVEIRVKHSKDAVWLTVGQLDYETVGWVELEETRVLWLMERLREVHAEVWGDQDES